MNVDISEACSSVDYLWKRKGQITEDIILMLVDSFPWIISNVLSQLQFITLLKRKIIVLVGEIDIGLCFTCLNSYNEKNHRLTHLSLLIFDTIMSEYCTKTSKLGISPNHKFKQKKQLI